MMQAVLPHMRNQRDGYVVTISAISAISAPNGLGFYAASKKALEALHEADAPILYNQWNIKLCLIEPGNVLTPTEHMVHKVTIGNRPGFNPSMTEIDGKIEDPYKHYIKKSIGLYKIMLPFSGILSKDVATFIIEQILNDEYHLRYQIGDDAVNLAKQVWVDPLGDFVFEKRKKQ